MVLGVSWGRGTGATLGCGLVIRLSAGALQPQPGSISEATFPSPNALILVPLDFMTVCVQQI